MHVSLSLFLSLSLFTFAKTVWIQIRPEWNSGKNVSSIYKIVHAIESMQSVVQKPMRTIKWVFSNLNKCIHCPVPCADPDGGQGIPTPPPPEKNIEFLSNTGPDPLEFSKLPSQHSTFGPSSARKRNAI